MTTGISVYFVDCSHCQDKDRLYRNNDNMSFLGLVCDWLIHGINAVVGVARVFRYSLWLISKDNSDMTYLIQLGIIKRRFTLYHLSLLHDFSYLNMVSQFASPVHGDCNSTCILSVEVF
jgi:hypothetical protein